MEAIRSTSPLVLFLSYRKVTSTKQWKQQLFMTKSKQQMPLSSNNSISRIQAINNVVSAAATSQTSAGDISVLIPVSAVLLFIYWIANFVVPGMIMDDLQAKSAEEDSFEEPDTSSSTNARTSNKTRHNKKAKPKKTAEAR